MNEFQYRITIDSQNSKLTFNQIETKNQTDGAESLHPIKSQLNKSKKGGSEYRNRPFIKSIYNCLVINHYLHCVRHVVC